MPERDRRTAQPSTVPGSPDADPGTLAELVGDCRRIAARWAAPESPPAEPVPPSRIRGTKVPPKSARAVDGMPDYGS